MSTGHVESAGAWRDRSAARQPAHARRRLAYGSCRPVLPASLAGSASPVTPTNRSSPSAFRQPPCARTGPIRLHFWLHLLHDSTGLDGPQWGRSPSARTPANGACGLYMACLLKRGTEESNLEQGFWRPPCYRYTSPPGERIVGAGRRFSHPRTPPLAPETPHRGRPHGAVPHAHPRRHARALGSHSGTTGDEGAGND